MKPMLELSGKLVQIPRTPLVFLIAIGGGQLVFGPVIDAAGRCVPLLVALVVFVASSVMASFATTL